MKQFNMFMHLAQFSGFIIPIAGFILPILMWATNKQHDSSINEHGKNITNWLISVVIYVIAGCILTMILVGFVVLFALGVCVIVFPILGAIKANKGEIYKYPLTIKFIK